MREARTNAFATNGTDDGGNSTGASEKPGEAEGRQPPDLEGDLGYENALTGATNDSPEYRMSFQ